MPHQRNDHPLPPPFAARGGPSLVRDGQEPHPHPMHHHVFDFQGRPMGPRMIHHSPGSPHGMMQARQPPMFRGHHPHSPASWGYASVHGSPHRVPGGLSAASSGENLMEEQQMPRQERSPNSSRYTTDRTGEMRNKADIISEAIKRHMDDDRSIGTNEADAASALLSATTIVRHPESNTVSGAEATKQQDQESEDKGDTTTHDQNNKPNENHEEEKKEETYESKVPLKKRRKLLDFIRQKPDATDHDKKQPLHVSPLPSPAGQSHAAQSPGSSEETVAISSPQRTAGSSSTCLESSYDVKDAQTLHDGAKISNTAEISPPPSQVVIEHFPMALHNVLSKSEFAGNVVQWVANGKAWKIVRWDALRRKVLPKYFAKLQDEDGNIGSSIDAFLYNVTSWGFEEVQDGPDAGAYSHELFNKETPELCRRMTFSPKQNDLESPTAFPKKTPSTISQKLNEASQRHSILQVPSLTSSTKSVDGDRSNSQLPKDAAKQREGNTEFKKDSVHSPVISYPMAGRPRHHPETPVYMGYRMHEMAYATEGFHYYPESPHVMRHLGTPGGLTGYDRRLMAQQAFEFGAPRRVSMHNSPRLQSGRGAMRLAAAARAGSLPGTSGHQQRSSFPVSNRGKGNRISSPSRIPVPASESSQSSTTAAGALKEHEPEETTELQRFSEKVAERVAVAVSKKTKRKLPLSSDKTSVESGQEGKQESTHEEKEPEQEGVDSEVKNVVHV